MSVEGKSRRLRERLSLDLPLRIQGRESLNDQWMEMTRVMDVTPFGARFTLERPVKVGRLIRLTLPMPREMRCFDHLDRLYQAWALVRNIEEITREARAPRFAVGVAFVGKDPPISYVKDPLTLLRATSRTKLAAAGCR